ncbi:hypothetical protein U1Q18_043670 [Sarracenia purpurea var. burkii]
MIMVLIYLFISGNKGKKLRLSWNNEVVVQACGVASLEETASPSMELAVPPSVVVKACGVASLEETASPSMELAVPPSVVARGRFRRVPPGDVRGSDRELAAALVSLPWGFSDWGWRLRIVLHRGMSGVVMVSWRQLWLRIVLHRGMSGVVRVSWRQLWLRIVLHRGSSPLGAYRLELAASFRREVCQMGLVARAPAVASLPWEGMAWGNQRLREW